MEDKFKFFSTRGDEEMMFKEIFPSYLLYNALYKRYEGNISLNIISSSPLVEKNLNLSSINKLRKIANKLCINLIFNQVVAIDNLELKLDNEDKIQSDLILLSTGAPVDNNIKSD